MFLKFRELDLENFYPSRHDIAFWVLFSLKEILLFYCEIHISRDIQFCQFFET